MLYYVDDCIYWYISEELGKWFVDTLGNIFNLNFLGYEHCFMSIRISQLNYHSISVDQARYATSVVAKYLNTDTIKENSNFHKTTLSHDIIFTTEDAYASDEQVEVLSRYYIIHYRTCVGSLIYLFFKE